MSILEDNYAIAKVIHYVSVISILKLYFKEYLDDALNVTIYIFAIIRPPPQKKKIRVAVSKKCYINVTLVALNLIETQAGNTELISVSLFILFCCSDIVTIFMATHSHLACQKDNKEVKTLDFKN